MIRLITTQGISRSLLEQLSAFKAGSARCAEAGKDSHDGAYTTNVGRPEASKFSEDTQFSRAEI